MRLCRNSDRRQSGTGGSPEDREAIVRSDEASLPDNITGFLRDFALKAGTCPPVRRIFLYGSYAQGCWREDSDVDIAVFIQNSGEVDVREVYKRLSNLCYEYPLDVQIQVFSESELLDPIGIVEEVIQYGIELKDFL